MYNAVSRAFFFINVRMGCNYQHVDLNGKCVLWHFADDFYCLNGKKPVLQIVTRI